MKYRLTSENFFETAETIAFFSRQVMQRIKYRPSRRYVDPNKYGGLWVVLLILATLLVLMAVVYGIYACIKIRRSRRDYNNRPETFVKHPRLNILEKLNRDDYFFEPVQSKTESKNVEIVKKELMQGFVEEVTFPPCPEWTSIRFNRKLEQTSYFEVEVLSLKSQISLGLIHAKQYTGKMSLESEVSQVGIGISQNGLVKHNGIFMYNFELKINYGDTIGIGITSPQQRVWFTHNGRFMNPPSYFELEQWERQAINQSEGAVDKQSLFQRIFDGDNEEKIPVDNNYQDVNQHDVERINQRVKLNYETFQFYAVVSCRGSTNGYLNVNSGGQLFRYAVPEFEKGLYLEEYKQKLCGWIRQLM